VENKLGKIKASSPAADGAGDGGGAATSADTSLPDPTLFAALSLLGLLLAAIALAAILDATGATTKAFLPNVKTSANFGIFAAFYVVAQGIERLLELVSPAVPLGWEVPDLTGTAKAAQIKADRAAIMLGIAAVLGVGASCGFGLYLLQAIGMDTPLWIDAFFTGITIAAGTKPLHDFISLLQNQTTPQTGTDA
jgi:hypothetical protein